MDFEKPVEMRVGPEGLELIVPKNVVGMLKKQNQRHYISLKEIYLENEEKNKIVDKNLNKNQIKNKKANSGNKKNKSKTKRREKNEEKEISKINYFQFYLLKLRIDQICKFKSINIEDVSKIVKIN